MGRKKSKIFLCGAAAVLAVSFAGLNGTAKETEIGLQETEAQEEALEKEKRLQKAMLDIKKRYGKNAILKGSNLQEGATAQHRNSQIGGHRA